MNKIIEISSCTECMNFLSERIYTSDSWDFVQKWSCKKYNIIIDGYHDVFDDDPGIPKECPLKTVE